MNQKRTKPPIEEEASGPWFDTAGLGGGGEGGDYREESRLEPHSHHLPASAPHNRREHEAEESRVGMQRRHHRQHHVKQQCQRAYHIIVVQVEEVVSICEVECKLCTCGAGGEGGG